MATTSASTGNENKIWYLIGFIFLLIIFGSLIIYSHDMAQDGVNTICGTSGSAVNDIGNLFSC